MTNKASGVWASRPGEFSYYIQSLRFSSHVLENVLHIEPWDILGPAVSFMKQVGREFNGAADFLANKVLDENRDIDIMIEGVGAMTWNIEVPLHMVVWSDGASRGNPGPGSCAACLGIMRPCEDLHRIEIGSAPLFFLCIDGKDYFCQTVACKGVRLGITTSNNSEFEAACLARRLIVDWLQRAQFLC